METPQPDLSQLRLSRGEYWLLETAVDLIIPLSCLLPKRCSLEELFNKPGHGLSQPTLIDTLIRLVRLRWISIGTYDDVDPPELNEAQLAAALDSDVRGEGAITYRLTERGGAAWEAFAAPAWNRFICEDFDWEKFTGTISSADRHWLENHLKNQNLYDKEIDRATLRIEELGEWQATYWKKLPSGFRATFSWSEAPKVRVGMEFLAFVGACKIRDGWYRR